MNIFEESDGVWSIRRVLAAILVAAAIAAIICGIVFGVVWQVVAAGAGLPLLAAVLLLFFTTWSDIESVISAAKGKSA